MLIDEQVRRAGLALETPLISIVAPFYNEQDGIEVFFEQIIATMESIESVRFEIVCINDGSRDATLEKLVLVSQRDRRVKVIDLTRNFGKEAALTAGLHEASGDAVVVIDADLQDPPSLIPEMIQRWRQGAEVVLARRASRACDSFLKRTTAALFYRIHNALSELKIPENVGDFRLMDRQVVNALRSLPERHRFMKGLFAWVGFNTVTIDYERTPRSAGKTKFSGWRLWNFALEGITSFSTVPLRIWMYIGGAIAALAFCYGTFMVGRTFLFGNPVPGYASLVSVVLFMSGIQLVGIGVIGEYVGRIYDESKERPVYLVRRRYEARASISVLPVERAEARTHSAPLELVSWRDASQVRAAGR
ncbi:MAG TPA: glycosyltransferase family 2 protein [Paraburkholderia sp.]|uniref:glycosyltransferase family 2 protein n=1 Tax=Paraburkholderia sp. TaxID=1926495 RepID=UPI002B4737DE|nr:glycosyltransferase family 2 protein [Paraburkholderia sp.]HKR38744.1 glycosyltransferase family 2 protein [Paraburkholderia sp.]